MRQLSLFLVITLFWGCETTTNSKAAEEPTGVSYAERFSVEEHEGYKIIRINKPWNGSDEEIAYLLYDGVIPAGIDESAYIMVPYPVQRIVSNSTTHLAFLEILGVEDRLVGFADTQYIYSEQINQQVANEQTLEVGNEGQLDVERILSLQPDVILAFSSGSENRQLNKLEELGQTVVMTPDYMEPTILGRAEWIKFIGHLTGKDKEAEAYFDKVATAYDSLLALVQTEQRPTVFSGSLYGGSWFMPSGNNYNGLMIQEAGGEYLWSDTEASGWLNLDFEAVYAKAYEAQYWIGVADYKSLEAMKNADERYAGFKAYTDGNIYGYTRRTSERGGNDYFESGNAQPHLLLADHVKILHPELLPDYELYYYQQLQ